MIRRFSEDIDLAVDYAALGFTGLRDPRQAALSKSKRAALLEALLTECQRYIRVEFVPALRSACSSVLGAQAPWDVSVDERDHHIVRFRYPEGVTQRLTYVAPQVLLELGTHAEFIPRGDFSIRSFVAQEFPEIFEVPDVPVTALLAKRTFWEKVTILHAEYHRPVEKSLPSRYSRHYYDVAAMAGTPLKSEAIADLDLLKQVVRHKEEFYPAAWAKYGLAVPGTLHLLPSEHRLAALKADYRNTGVMIFGDPPPFEKIFETLSKLEIELNDLGR